MRDVDAHPQPAIATPDGWHTTQATLAGEGTVSGRGLHTRGKARVRLLPSVPGAEGGGRGIVFRRLRRWRRPAEISVTPDNHYTQPLCTMLRNGDGIGVRLVEHILAAFMMCEIDHAVVELDNEELPNLDGGAGQWSEAIRGCGRRALPEPKPFLKVTRPLRAECEDGKRWITLEPADRCVMSVRTTLRGFKDLKWSGTLTPAVFREEIAMARTYGRVKWAIPLILWGFWKRTPVMRGATPGGTAMIWGDNKVIGGLRAPNEFARHRVLDLTGDLALLGAPLLAKIVAFRPCHDLNYQIIRQLLDTPGALSRVEAAGYSE